MQLNIFYTLHQRMQALDIGYFDLATDVLEAFDIKRGDIQEQAEALGITHFKTQRPVSSRVPNKYGSRADSISTTSPSSRYGGAAAAGGPPSYGAATAGRPGRFGSLEDRKAPPLPAPKPGAYAANPGAEYVTALYDYNAQAPGDLSFRAGDRIEVVNRTDNANEWWTGRLNGASGNFPGNYVQFG